MGFIEHVCVYLCKRFQYVRPAVYGPSCLQECMDTDTRGWTAVQKRRRQWFWLICCSCAKERCCWWAFTSTSAIPGLYVRYGTAGPSCWFPWASLQIVVLFRQYCFSRSTLQHADDRMRFCTIFFNFTDLILTNLSLHCQSFFSANISGYAVYIYIYIYTSYTD